MTFWIFTFVLSIIVFVALIYSGRPSRSASQKSNIVNKTEEHFRVRLRKIQADFKAKKLSSADADDARAELARELMRHRAVMSDTPDAPTKSWVGAAISFASFAAIALAFVGYLGFGTPFEPVIEPEIILAQSEAEVEFQDAIERVELRTQTNPDDIRAWQVLSSAYVNSGRYSDAVNAFRNILELEPATSDRITDLAQALLMVNPAEVDPEAISLLQSAVEIDPTHARSRFFLAVDATRREDWDDAIGQWNSLLDLASDDEPWIDAALESRDIALARGQKVVQPPLSRLEELDADPIEPTPVDADPTEADPADGVQAPQIISMVQQLDKRLSEEGGTIEEWTQLVRSYLVLYSADKAREAYENAVEAYPDESERAELQRMVEQSDLLQQTE